MNAVPVVKEQFTHVDGDQMMSNQENGTPHVIPILLHGLKATQNLMTDVKVDSYKNTWGREMNSKLEGKGCMCVC